MVYDDCDIPAADGGDDSWVPIAVKILIAGGFGAGKTTLVGSLTEIRALRTEEDLTGPGTLIDTVAGVERKRTTTVAMDFGRITINEGLVVYLFGMPGQERFWFMWDELSYGMLGAVVLADTRRLADCFPAIDYFEHRKTPFVVALNCFDGSPVHQTREVRDALDIDGHVPIVSCDARKRAPSRDALVTLVEHAAAQLTSDPLASRTQPASR